MPATAPRPAFLISIDTEGDNLWSKPRAVTTENARFLPRFQGLCERYGFKPTYLTDWDMVRCPAYREFAADALARGAAEVGMHLHAWNSPPVVPLTEDDDRYHPYLIEYPRPLIVEKVKVLTDALEDAFGRKMTSHRAGRWSFDETYAGVLARNGYRVDCSVTPGVSWRHHRGDPSRTGGTDYSSFPDRAYYIDPRDLRRPSDDPLGAGCLLEVPMTVCTPRYRAPVRLAAGLVRPAGRLGGRIARRLAPGNLWLRPRGDNLRSLLTVVRHAVSEGRDYVEFMLHSSEFMPGGSPTFPSESSIEALYRDLEALFEFAVRRFEGMTLTEYADRFRASRLAGEPA